MEPTFKCPVCNGRLAFWAVRAEFVCTHCDMILKSNRAEALLLAFWVALLIEILFLLLLFFLLDVPLRAFFVWGGAGGVLGYWAGWIAIKRFMVFRPIRRKPTTGATHG
jgi:high-affinity Fe2+/Pb2+ permease